MVLVEILFWLNLLTLLYVYGGYVLFTLPFKKQTKWIDNGSRPKCTLVIAAFNEGKVIEDKILNSLALDYPNGMLDIVIVADGSTDHIHEIVNRYPSIRLFYQPERKGKLAAIQRILPAIQSEIVVFTDANCLLNKTAITDLVSHFADPGVGAVSGEKKVIKTPTAAATEGIYWKYESWLKSKDSQFYSIVGAAGELLALRTELYTILDEQLVLDDFIQSMLVCNQGYRVIYEKAAFASELPSPSLKDEFIRKVRIAAGGFQAINYLSDKMNFKKHLKLTFLYYSHRVFRWVLAPFCFFAILPLNTIIIIFKPNFLYGAILGLQVLCYIIAILRNFFSASGKSPAFISLIHYFFFMQIGAIAGLIKFKGRGQSATWEKIPRI
jgi:biofilm PGA synthesis N-glycosyltransferase PgaC